MAESKLAALSMDFAVKVLRLCDSIKGHYSLVNQLERSGTSIGANIREANYAHSRPDFIAKFQTFTAKNPVISRLCAHMTGLFFLLICHCCT